MAQYYIGRLYYEGRGVERSYEKAFEWIEKATINGSQEAKNFLPDLKNYLLPIMVAAKDNSIDTVKKLISTGLDVNAVYEQGMTALMVATIFNSVDVARFLIDAGADINTADIQARTPLMLAAIYNSIDVARLLIERGADINMTLKSEREEWLYRKRNIVPRNTPLMFAAIHNSVDVAKVLIEKGASVNVKVNIARDYRNRIPERDVSALEFAVRHNSIDIVKLFHDKKIESNNNILLYASRYDNIDIAKLAIEFGARKIINTVEENSPAIVKLLIDSGFHYGKTAFKFAVSHNLVPIAKLLLDAGADLIDDTVVRNKQHWKKSNIQFEFHPRNENVFKRLFILIGEAYRFFYLKNLDEPIFNIWHLTSFSMDSNLKACIFASTCYRENRTKGLYKIKLKIPGCEKYDDYSLEQVDQELEKIYQDVQQQQSNTHTKAINIINSQDKSSKQNENNSTENDSACVAAEEQYEIGLEFYKEKTS